MADHQTPGGKLSAKLAMRSSLHRVTMEDIATAWTMTQIHLDVIATVPKVAQCDFVEAALQAKANCPISRSLNANISMRAKLSQDGAPARPQSQRKLGSAGSSMFQKSGPRQNGGKSKM